MAALGGAVSMDLLYLARSGLGIPDYWHPRLELQTDFLSGEVGRYPFSMDVKADYMGELDGEGVPIGFEDGKPYVSPVNVVLFGLGSHDAFVRTGDERYGRQLKNALTWLDRHGARLGDGIGWASPNQKPAFGLRTPWFSAITQGFALSLLVRAHRLARGSDGLQWAELARATWLGLRAPVEEGGVCRRVGGGVIYEEYPGPELDCVFNGMCHALIGLWESWQSGVVPEAEADFQVGVDGLRTYLAQFDHHGWSLYSLNQCLRRPLLASPYYHRANGLLATIVGRMGAGQEFLSYGEKWLQSGRSVLRRIAMSLRIGFERYRGQPSLFASDTSERR